VGGGRSWGIAQIRENRRSQGHSPNSRAGGQSNAQKRRGLGEGEGKSYERKNNVGVPTKLGGRKKKRFGGQPGAKKSPKVAERRAGGGGFANRYRGIEKQIESECWRPDAGYLNQNC